MRRLRLFVCFGVIVLVAAISAMAQTRDSSSSDRTPPAAQAGPSTRPALRRGPLFSDGGNARKIVFACDASGSMITKIAQLKVQIGKAIHAMQSNQSFGIIFFQDGDCDALPTGHRLLRATANNKAKADTFLEGVTTSGTTDPLPGIKFAFEQHPQLIYLLTDGDSDTAYLELLKTIARETGGVFRHVTVDDLENASSPSRRLNAPRAACND
ncbi:MAG TPA: hypothetical protein VFC78_05755 [Tepidisphaeraceae bacterium]|nr:hypothetical protein [Tepidisphaeraceae bacterium]